MICFRLRGTVSNRDAIGTRITLHCGALTQARSLQAGSGFLAQHTKELFFGLGKGNEAVHAEGALAERKSAAATQLAAQQPRSADGGRSQPNDVSPHRNLKRLHKTGTRRSSRELDTKHPSNVAARPVAGS